MARKTIAKEAALAEITLRRYEKPKSFLLEKETSERKDFSKNDRELVRKLCLSIGLLQPGDSRDVIVEILQVLLDAKKGQQHLNSEEIKDMVIALRKKNNLKLKGIASSNIRRQLKRLKDVFLVENINNSYRITEFEDLDVIFEKRIEKYYLQNILERVREYFKAVR